MRARDRGHHARVHHPQPIDPVHLQFAINHAAVSPRHHGARADGVATRALRNVPDGGLDGGIAPDVRAPPDLLQPDGFPRFGGDEAAEGLDDLDEDA